MKKIITCAAIIALLISCNNTKTESSDASNTSVAENATPSQNETQAEPLPEATIVGEWHLADVDLGMTAPKGQEKTFDDLKKDMIAKTVYTFSEDGTINLVTPMAKSNGTYTYQSNTLTTVIKNKTESSNVKSLTANELIIAVTDRDVTMVMTFKK